MADDGEKVARKQRGRYREYMRHSNPYKFPAARRRKGNLYKAKQSSTGTRNDLNKCDVEEMIPDKYSKAETNSMILGEDCSYFEVQDMEDSSTFGLEEENNSRISGDEFELFDSADTNTFEQFVKDEDACSDIFSDCENPDEIDTECIPEHCGAESDDMLYSGAPITSNSMQSDEQQQ